MRTRNDIITDIGAQPYDLCVIGGGATGAGCALDAQLRGLRTVLLDGGDFASAASGASTKLVHGGVRYLEQAVKKLDVEEYRMVERALHERIQMLQNAPHLAHAAEFIVPVFSWLQAGYYSVGMKMYDWISGKDNLFPSRFLSKKEVLRRMPGLRNEKLRGAVAYSDGQFDDSRYDLSLVKTFIEAGGTALNYARVTEFSKNAAGKLSSAKVRDTLAQLEFAVRAEAFLNATGPASDSVRRMASPGLSNRLRPSKGVHILFPLEEFQSKDALLVPKTEDGRVIFAVPWQGRLLVGTTDDEATPETKMIVLREEAEYLLRQLNPYLAKPLRLENVVSAISGLRPLVAGGDGRDTKQLIRDHEVELDEKSGLVSVLGGKWTTHRLMAEDAINVAQRALATAVTECKTKNHPLAGAAGFSDNYWQALVRDFALEEATAKHLASKFGTRAPEVLHLIREDVAFGAKVLEGLPYLRAEIVYCVRQELAATIEDVLGRRLGLQLFDWRAAIAAAPVVAVLLARELGWSVAEQQEAVSGYVGKISSYLDALGLVHDFSSDGERTGA